MENLIDRIANLVGLPRGQLVEKLLRVDARVSHRVDSNWAAHLAIATIAGSGERSFEAEDCRSLVEGTALIVALAIDPTVQPTIQAPGAPKSAGAASRPSVVAAAKPQSDMPAQFLLRPLLVADLGILPDAGFGVGLAVGGTWRHLRFEIEGTRQAEQQLTDPQSPKRGGSVRTLLRSGARACVGVWQSRVEFDGCLGTAASWMRATGQHIASPVTNDALWVAVTAGVAANWHLVHRLWLRAEGHVGVGVRRPSFEIDPDTEVYRSPAFTAQLALGLEARF
jgi:hypothetical protein